MQHSVFRLFFVGVDIVQLGFYFLVRKGEQFGTIIKKGIKAAGIVYLGNTFKQVV